MWSYAVPNTNALILSSPNFQLVRSIVSVYGPSRGMRDLRYSATTSKSSTSCAMKRWMRRKLDSLEALSPNAPASLDKQTVCTVQSAPSSMERHLMWARFMDALKSGRITVRISLLLCETLMLRDMVIMWKLYTLKLRKIEVFSKYNYLKINRLKTIFSNFVMC